MFAPDFCLWVSVFQLAIRQEAKCILSGKHYPCAGKGAAPQCPYPVSDPLWRKTLKCEFDKFQLLNPGWDLSSPSLPRGFGTPAVALTAVYRICFALWQQSKGEIHYCSSFSLSAGLRENALSSFPSCCTAQANSSNTPSSPHFVRYVTSCRTKQTATFSKTEIVFKKFRLASCLESPSWERCLQNPHLMLLHSPCAAHQSVHLPAWHGASSLVGPVFIRSNVDLDWQSQ